MTWVVKLNRQGVSYLSQEELGYRAQLHRTEISLLGCGQRTPRIDTVMRLAGSLSAPVNDLLVGLEWTPGYVKDRGGRI